MFLSLLSSNLFLFTEVLLPVPVIFKPEPPVKLVSRELNTITSFSSLTVTTHSSVINEEILCQWATVGLLNKPQLKFYQKHSFISMLLFGIVYNAFQTKHHSLQTLRSLTSGTPHYTVRCEEFGYCLCVLVLTVNRIPSQMEHWGYLS